jgi:hypothetical protein
LAEGLAHQVFEAFNTNVRSESGVEIEEAIAICFGVND